MMSPRLYHHWKSTPGTDCEQRLGSHLSAGHSPRPPALAQRGQHQCAFGPGELLADAHASATPEREVRKLWSVGRERRVPALGPEFQWPLPPARVAMRTPRRDHQQSAFRRRRAAEYDGLSAPGAGGQSRSGTDATPRRRSSAHTQASEDPGSLAVPRPRPRVPRRRGDRRPPGAGPSSARPTPGSPPSFRGRRSAR